MLTDPSKFKTSRKVVCKQPESLEYEAKKPGFTFYVESGLSWPGTQLTCRVLNKTFLDLTVRSTAFGSHQNEDPPPKKTKKNKEDKKQQQKTKRKRSASSIKNVSFIYISNHFSFSLSLSLSLSFFPERRSRLQRFVETELFSDPLCCY